MVKSDRSRNTSSRMIRQVGNLKRKRVWTVKLISQTVRCKHPSRLIVPASTLTVLVFLCFPCNGGLFPTCQVHSHSVWPPGKVGSLPVGLLFIDISLLLSWQLSEHTVIITKRNDVLNFKTEKLNLKQHFFWARLKSFVLMSGFQLSTTCWNFWIFRECLT